MIKKIYSFLKKDAIIGELAYNTRKIFFIIAILVFFILFFYKPFLLDRLHIKTQLIIAVGSSLLAGIGYIIAISIFMPFKREKWTVVMEFITVITTFIFAWILIYSYLSLCFKYKLPEPFYIDEIIIIPQGFFLKTLLYTLGTGSLIYLILYMYNNIKFHKGTSATMDVNTKNNVLSKNEINKTALKLTGKNKDEQLIISRDDFVLAKSEGHYIKIYYLNDKSQNLNNYVLRNTMKSLEKNLVDYNSIYRCHKSFFINLGYIKSVIGNSNKSHIYIKHYPNRIPISKQKINYLKEIIKKFK